jgi:hypothetical protein
VVWENHTIDPVIVAVVTFVIGPTLVSWAPNEIGDVGNFKTVLTEPATRAVVL